MKLFFLIIMLSLPLYGLAWDGSGYDYKKGSAVNANRDLQVFRANEGEWDDYDPKKYHDHNIEAFQSLGNSFTIEIPDPGDYLKTEIESMPDYLWQDSAKGAYQK